MTTLNLGVVDLTYVHSPKENGAPSRDATVTTGDVAGFLENRYHVMEIFYESNKDVIAAQMAESVAGALESVLMGAPAASANPYGTATGQIEASFRQFLDRDGLAALGYPGTPTKAAQAGVNHRLKTSKGATRPSFIDTGLYQSAFVSWVD